MTPVHALKRFVPLVGVVLVVGCGYNTIQTYDEQVNAAAAQIKVQLQRRADLIPNLVETVKAYVKQERTVFTEVSEARAKLAGAVQSGDLQQMAEANRQLTAPLGRLLAIAEARQDYNEAVNHYNAYIRRFPQVLTAKLLGKGPRPYFELETPGAAQAPKVDFSK